MTDRGRLRLRPRRGQRLDALRRDRHRERPAVPAERPAIDAVHGGADAAGVAGADDARPDRPRTASFSPAGSSPSRARAPSTVTRSHTGRIVSSVTRIAFAGVAGAAAGAASRGGAAAGAEAGSAPGADRAASVTTSRRWGSVSAAQAPATIATAPTASHQPRRERDAGSTRVGRRGPRRPAAAASAPAPRSLRRLGASAARPASGPTPRRARDARIAACSRWSSTRAASREARRVRGTALLHSHRPSASSALRVGDGAPHRRRRALP